MQKKPSRFSVGMMVAMTASAGAVLSVTLIAAMYLTSGAGSQGAAGQRAAFELKSGEKAATIQVQEGSGWLSTGEEIQIAEWYSGSDREAGEYFANFRGSDGGATVDLRLAGLNRSGTFACADLQAPAAVAREGGAYVELRVDVQNTYQSGQSEGSCEVTVTRLDAQVMEGHYKATLVNSGNAADDVTITGRFRATKPQSERLTAVTVPKVAEL